jgi:uncharacterized protein (TIGR03083 family)
MTGEAIEALRAERDVVLGIGARLAAEDWSAPSGCAGWSVQDVLSHLGATYWMVASPRSLPDVTGLPAERAQDAYVQARRPMSPDQTMADYEQASGKAIEILGMLARSEREMPLGDLGTYPAHMVPNAFCFDHYTHIRVDLFPPRGPLTGAAPAADELLLCPVMDWMEAALPQQCGHVLAELNAPVEIVVSGPAGRAIHLGPAGAAAARITGSADSFLRWATQRAGLAEAGAEAAGDEQALGVIGKIRVY